MTWNNGDVSYFFKIFVSWKNLSRRRNRRLSSMIPLPISPAYSMPMAGSVHSSGSSTPTDELNPPYSPVFNKPSQIPQPQVIKRKKSLSARNSPTGSMEKLSTYKSSRRGSIYWCLEINFLVNRKLSVYWPDCGTLHDRKFAFRTWG